MGKNFIFYYISFLNINFILLYLYFIYYNNKYLKELLIFIY